MSYADLIDDETISQNFLAVLTPRFMLTTGWSLVSGSIYKASFTKDVPRQVFNKKQELTQASSSSVSSDEWYYDLSAQELYVDVAGDPSDENIVILYELYIGTFDAHAYRDPTDDTSESVYFEPIITSTPSISSSSTDNLFGFSPTTSSSMSTSSVTGFWENHISTSSFNNCRIQVYHWLGDIFDVDNVSKIIDSSVNNINYDKSNVVLSIRSSNSVFEREFRPNLPVSYTDNYRFYDPSNFSSLDPSHLFSPVRRIYGVAKNIVPINVTYKIETPTTSDNRSYGVMTAGGSFANITGTATGTPTTTSTTFTTWPGFLEGDHFHTSTSNYGRILSVNVSTKTVTHTTITALTAGQTLTVNKIRSVVITRDSVRYYAMPVRDYNDSTVGSNSSIVGFTFTGTMETNLFSPSDALNPNSDLVYCTAQGQQPEATLGGPVFGSNSELTNSLSNVVACLYEVIKNYAGVDESEIDTASFVSLEASTLFDVGFSIPSRSTSEFPKIKDVITSLTKAGLLKISKNSDNKWTIDQSGPLPVSSEKDIEDDEILDGTFKYAFNYNDIVSEVKVKYDFKEKSDTAFSDAQWSNSLSESDVAKYLHDIDAVMELETVLIDADQADLYSQNVSFVFGDRQGVIQLSAKNRFFDTNMNDRIDVSLEKMPGFNVVRGVKNLVSASVDSLNKGLRSVTLIINDQFGIEQNKDDWNG